jgi:hypothetical protein
VLRAIRFNLRTTGRGIACRHQKESHERSYCAASINRIKTAMNVGHLWNTTMRLQFGRRKLNRFKLVWSDVVALLAVAASVAIVFRQVLGL